MCAQDELAGRLPASILSPRRLFYAFAWSCGKIVVQPGAQEESLSLTSFFPLLEPHAARARSTRRLSRAHSLTSRRCSRLARFAVARLLDPYSLGWLSAVVVVLARATGRRSRCGGQRCSSRTTTKRTQQVLSCSPSLVRGDAQPCERVRRHPCEPRLGLGVFRG